jgi:hypothetical protein
MRGQQQRGYWVQGPMHEARRNGAQGRESITMRANLCLQYTISLRAIASGSSVSAATINAHCAASSTNFLSFDTDLRRSWHSALSEGLDAGAAPSTWGNILF